MTKKLTSLFFLTLFVSAVLVVSGLAYSNGSSGNGLVRTSQYSLLKHGTSVLDEASPVTVDKHVPMNSLGSYTADGGSPGYIVARTYQDMQTWYGASHRIEWRHSPQVHFMWEQQDLPGADLTISANWLMYNAYDPEDLPNGSFAATGGAPLNTSPFTYITEYANADVDETGHMIISGHSSNPGADPRVRSTETFWDNAGVGTWGSFIGDTLPKSLAISPTGSQAYPKIEYQEYNGQQITHLLVDEFAAPGYLTYWRRVGGNGTYQGWTTTIITDSAGPYLEGMITASRENPGGQGGKVAITWTQNMDDAHTAQGDDWGSNIAYIESTDAGLTWSAVKKIINFDPNTDNEVAWIENYALYDSEGYLHIVFNTQLYSNGTAGSIDPSRVMHWTDRVSGPNAGGTMTTVTIADFHGLASVCGRAGTNVLNTGKPLVSECNGRLYTLWQQFGDPDNGDSLDCANPEVLPLYNYNPDLFMSVSLSLDGSLWDAARNLTNSKTPGCDTTAGNECDYDNYPTVSRYGMNASDFSGITWNAVSPQVFQVRDALDAGYPESGYFLDVFYVDDFFPGVPRFSSKDINPDIWTYNPLKWFRLPCVAPVIQPRIFISQPDYEYPTYWVKSGQEKSFDVRIENIGNDVLNVTSINANLSGGTPPGAVAFSTPSITVAAGSSELVGVTLNPGGFITATAGTGVPIVADLEFNSNDPNRPQITLGVNTIVADTVVQITWDTVYTGTSSAWRLGLTVANNGNAGRAGAAGRVNLDFVNTGLECDTANALVYLYDLSPVIMYDVSHYSWQPFYNAARVNRAFNFEPVPGSAAKHNSATNFDSYTSELFVTVDSTIGLIKSWYTPKADVSYAIERIQVFSYDGSSHPGARIGEWIDWDIPSDSSSNNMGGFVFDPGSVDYMWMRGLEYTPGADCIDNDRRYGASGLLGYYHASEYAADTTVNHTGLYGGFVQLDDDIFETGTDNTFIPDSAWAFLNRAELAANNSVAADQQIWLSFGSFTVDTDTLTLWVVHASMYDGDETALQAIIDAAEAWYTANRLELLNPSCCGKYTGGYTGNTNCDELGAMNLQDVTRLIDRIYLSKADLCCEENGDTNGDGSKNLQDVTRLIDHIYLSKNPTATCP